MRRSRSSILFLGPGDRALVARRDELHDPPSLGGGVCLRAPARLRLRSRADRVPACPAQRAPARARQLQRRRRARPARLRRARFSRSSARSACSRCAGRAGSRRCPATRWARSARSGRSSGWRCLLGAARARRSFLPDVASRTRRPGRRSASRPASRIRSRGSTTCWRWSRSGCGARSSARPRSGCCRSRFRMVMAFGGMLGLLGVPLPGIEYGIAASAMLLGAAVMFELRPPLVVAARARRSLRDLPRARARHRAARRGRARSSTAWASSSRPAVCTRWGSGSARPPIRPWGRALLRVAGAGVALRRRVLPLEGVRVSRRSAVALVLVRLRRCVRRAAEAHLNSTGMGPLYDGAAHFLTSPGDLLSVLALALFAGLRGAGARRDG